MRRTFLLTVPLVGLLALAAVGHHLWTSPNVVLLTPADGADWIRPDRPFNMDAQQVPSTVATFQTTFAVPNGFAGATLTVTALKRVAVAVDGSRLFDPGPASGNDWKTPHAVLLPSTLTPGPHKLRLDVGNRYGPAIVRASCDALGIHTGHGDWGHAVALTNPWRPALVDQWGPSAPALWRCLPLLLALFAIGGGIGLRRPAGDWGRRARWAVLAAWVVLGAADLTRVPLAYGYDAHWHYQYIQYVADHARLPPPDEGVQFFQAPLYYVVSAILWRALAIAGATAGQLPFLVRVVPLACGAALAEVCYRSARHAFPGRSDLHAVAVVVGGLIPVNLYMGLAVSNEPMAGCLGGAVALLGMRFLSRPTDATNPRWLAGAGAMLGVAVLAKVSMGLWAVPLLLAVAVAAGRRAVRSVAIVVTVAVVVCGGYLVRTWRVAGTPVLSHTVLRGTSWWQDPGYRTPANLLTFGRGLTRTAYGGVDSVSDSLYSTTWGNGFLSGVIDANHTSPWHTNLMAAGLWLALLPTAAIGIGALVGRPKGGRWFPCLSVALFVTALVWVYLTLPIYSCAKGSYLLSTLPCVAVLASAGLDRLMVGPRSRAGVVGLLTCWAAASYGTYVVTG